MTSRDTILRRLRQAQRPFADAPAPPESYTPMTPLAGDTAVLRDRFIAEAEALSAQIYRPASEAAALEAVLGSVGDARRVLAWAFDQIPLPGLAQALDAAGIAVAALDDSDVTVGISGADAALAATGSLVLSSGSGRYRATTLLPTIHIAVIRESQIVANFEAWVARQRAAGLDALRASSNVVVVSGASRTADIALELILGMHGPAELHIVLLPG